MSTLATVFGYGLLSARAAASVAGRFYYATDTTFMYRDNGSTWDTLTVGAGSMATDGLWDAAGDLAVGTGANTAAKLTLGATNGMALQRVAGAVAWALPTGYEWDYVEITSPISVTGTSEGSPTTCITSNSKTYDGAPVLVTASAPYLQPDSVADRSITVFLADSVAGILGNFCYIENPATGANYFPLERSRRFTPSAAAHVLTVKAHVSAGTGSFGAGGGGSAQQQPAFIRITKV